MRLRERLSVQATEHATSTSMATTTSHPWTRWQSSITLTLHKKWLEENKDSFPDGYESSSFRSGFKAAKWAENYRPERWEDALWDLTSERTVEDENRTTLEYMREYGIENVRGGEWCMVDMEPRTVRELEELIAKLDD